MAATIFTELETAIAELAANTANTLPSACDISLTHHSAEPVLPALMVRAGAAERIDRELDVWRIECDAVFVSNADATAAHATTAAALHDCFEQDGLEDALAARVGGLAIAAAHVTAMENDADENRTLRTSITLDVVCRFDKANATSDGNQSSGDTVGETFGPQPATSSTLSGKLTLDTTS